MILVRSIIYYTCPVPSSFLSPNHECNSSTKCFHFDFVDWFSSVTHSNKTKQCSASQLQDECKNIDGTVPKFKDKREFKRKMKCSDLNENETYWTALRYEQVYHRRKT